MSTKKKWGVVLVLIVLLLLVVACDTENPGLVFKKEIKPIDIPDFSPQPKPTPAIQPIHIPSW